MCEETNEEQCCEERAIDIDTAERTQSVVNRENFEAMLVAQNLWGHSDVGLQAKRAAMTMLSTKTGMYAKIPLLCKADSCPYSDNCPLLPYDLAPHGEYCPVETAQIELRAISYSQEFDLENASFTDKNLVNEIISLDIMLERCKALMAKEGTPVVEIVAGMTERGEEIKQPAVSKAWEAYEKMSKKRNEDYQLMMATRKDKKDNGEGKEKTVTEIIAEAIGEEGFMDVEERPEHFKEE
jgi:hypothetical protein